MAQRPVTTIDPARIAELTEHELEHLNESTKASAAMFDRARRALSAGVASSYQLRDPWPIYVERGEGAYIWDVDGTRRIDFHNGFGSMVQGHAHPAVTAAVAARMPLGTHFAVPTEDAVIVAEELQRRFGLSQWRFTNSGSEATMDAIRIARAHTGRDVVMKIFGSYHGHHDAVMVGVSGVLGVVGDRTKYLSRTYGEGIPRAVSELTVPVPFNDLESIEARLHSLEREGRLPACLIMEAAMMNLGVILPEPGFLEGLRELTRERGIVWIVDEVKTGLTVAAGGATERFGIEPDLVTLAKALGAGIPSGAIGGTDEMMECVRDGRVYQVGTFNGNPLTMAAARASLLEILTPDAYAHLDRLNARILAGCDDVIDRHGLPGYTVGISSKGCVTFATERVVDYETFVAHQNAELSDLAWLWNLNRGIFMTPGREEEWTLSVRHTEEDVDRFVAVFDELAAALTRS
jgi:glutamate-1-semialdehyde 2,1-aminomutase